MSHSLRRSQVQPEIVFRFALLRKTPFIIENVGEMHRVGTQPHEALQKIPEKGHRNKHLWAGEKTMVFMKSNATTCSLGFEEGEKLQDWKSPQARKG